MSRAQPSFLAGIGLIVLYCLLATGADAITRIVSQSFAAPQLFFFSGVIVASLSLLANAAGPAQGQLRSKAPGLLALRALFFILACIFYFFAFRFLPFAEVFAFIAFVPLISALLSGPVLGETVPWQSWIALAIGACGMLLLYPSGLLALGFGHLSAALGAIFGAMAMVLARLVSRYEGNALLQVLYPNLAIAVVMGAALPFVYRPMGASDIAQICAYGVLLFFARWVLVLALSRIKAYVVTLLINLQFVVMIAVGALLFGEMPQASLLTGATLIIGAGAYLLRAEIAPTLQSLRPKPRKRRYPHARSGHLDGTGPLALTLRS